MLRFGLWYGDDHTCQALCMGVEISKTTGGSFCIGTGEPAVICVGYVPLGACLEQLRNTLVMEYRPGLLLFAR